MWEAELEKLGPDVRGHFEAQRRALDLVLDIATRQTPIGEAYIRELHAEVCAHQQTYRAKTQLGWQDIALPKGEYKSEPNHVVLSDGSMHWYAAPDDVGAEMHRLVEQFHSEEFLAAPSLLQSAYAHHALVTVHPFADGNGRTARALASVFLYREAGIPLVIFKDQQIKYWDALAAADDGELQPFIIFVEDRALDTLAMLTDRLQQAQQKSLDDRGRHIRRLLISHSDFS